MSGSSRERQVASLELSFDQITLKSKEFDIDEISSQDDFIQRRYTDAIYMGIMKNGRRHGKGVMKYVNNRQYEGEWENDTRDGRGYEHYPNGNVYHG